MAQHATSLSPEPESGLPGESIDGPGGPEPQTTQVPGMPAPSGRGFRIPQFLSLLLGNGKSLFGLVLLGTLVLLAVFAPLITRHGPSDMFLTLPGQPPSGGYWFGTNQQGQDLFSQVLYGARSSLFIAATAAALA